MSERYTPTTEQVEDAYAHDPESEYRDPVNYGSEVQAHRRVFRRWLAAHDAEVARKALTDAADAFKSGQLTGMFMGRDDYAREWLRRRAEQIGENHAND